MIDFLEEGDPLDLLPSPSTAASNFASSSTDSGVSVGGRRLRDDELERKMVKTTRRTKRELQGTTIVSSRPLRDVCIFAMNWIRCPDNSVNVSRS